MESLVKLWEEAYDDEEVDRTPEIRKEIRAIKDALVKMGIVEKFIADDVYEDGVYIIALLKSSISINLKGIDYEKLGVRIAGIEGAYKVQIGIQEWPPGTKFEYQNYTVSTVKELVALLKKHLSI